MLSLAAALREIILKPTLVGPNVWIRLEMRPDGYEYYEMLIFYTDDITIIFHLGDQVSKQIGGFYNIKEVIQVPPTWYLGVDKEKIQNEDGHEIWTTSSSYYITNAFETVEGLLLEDGKCEVLKYNVRNPFP